MASVEASSQPTPEESTEKGPVSSNNGEVNPETVVTKPDSTGQSEISEEPPTLDNTGPVQESATQFAQEDASSAIGLTKEADGVLAVDTTKEAEAVLAVVNQEAGATIVEDDVAKESDSIMQEEVVADSTQSEEITVAIKDAEQPREDSSNGQLDGDSSMDVSASSTADAAAALQILAAQTSGMSAPEAIAHLQQVLQVPSHVVSSLVSEVASEVIVMAQQMQNAQTAEMPATPTTPKASSSEGQAIPPGSAESKASEEQAEIITLSSNQIPEDQGEAAAPVAEPVVAEGEIVPSTSSSTVDAAAAAALQALASQTSGMSTPDAIAHLQQMLQVPSHLVSSLVNEVASEVIVMAQAVQNSAQAIESLMDEDQADQGTESGEDGIDEIKKTKSGMLKIHKCPECNKGFSLRSTLTKHLQRHNHETKCTQCDKMFFSPVKLATHVRTHHTTTEKVKDVICPECGKGFYNHAKLRVHMRTHTGERPFPCAFCEKRFVCTSHRKRHERLHTGEHPFVCETCGKGFGSPSNLKDHTYTHTKENPYPCNICGKGFTQWGAMMRHIAAIHEKRKDVKCPHCNKCFARKDYLKLHIQKCHWNKCPVCKDTFESDEMFELHKKECVGAADVSPSSSITKTPRSRSSPRLPAKRKQPSSASPRKGQTGKSPLLTPVRKKPRKSPAVPPVNHRRKRADPAHVDQLLSIYEQFDDDPLADPEYKAEEGEDGEGEITEEMVEEVLEEVEDDGDMEEIVEEEGVNLEQEDILVQEVNEVEAPEEVGDSTAVHEVTEAQEMAAVQ